MTERDSINNSSDWSEHEVGSEAEFVAKYHIRMERGQEPSEDDREKYQEFRQRIDEYVQQNPKEVERTERMVQEMEGYFLQPMRDVEDEEPAYDVSDSDEDAQAADDESNTVRLYSNDPAGGTSLRDRFWMSFALMAEYELRKELGESLEEHEHESYRASQESVREWLEEYPEDREELEELREEKREWVRRLRKFLNVKSGAFVAGYIFRRQNRRGARSSVRPSFRPPGLDTGQRPMKDIEAEWARMFREENSHTHPSRPPKTRREPFPRKPPKPSEIDDPRARPLDPRIQPGADPELAGTSEEDAMRREHDSFQDQLAEADLEWRAFNGLDIDEPDVEQQSFQSPIMNLENSARPDLSQPDPDPYEDPWLMDPEMMHEDDPRNDFV